jgi:ADP-ribosyl-[dinitrogen reductase] hydrolase
LQQTRSAPRNGSAGDHDEFIQEKVYGALLGLAVGDALGAPLEFCGRDEHPPVRDLIGGGPFDLAPGCWTDDTSMALCLADSLIARRGFDEADLLGRFIRWWVDGEKRVTGHCFDIGIATRHALEHFQQHGAAIGAGGVHMEQQAGNGSLMRLAPVAIFSGTDADRATTLADQQSRTTHASNECADACRLFATMLVESLSGLSRDEVLRPRDWSGSSKVASIAGGAWRDKSRDQISSSGYVISTLEAALWCVGRTDDFEKALVLAVNLGDDADTIGAVTGQLAGAIYGRQGIPAQWLKDLAWKRHIEERAEALWKAGRG